jgi:acyl carrier protein
MVATEREIREFIIDNFLFGEMDFALSSEDSLLERGIIDSTGVLELVAFLESRYGIQIKDHEILPSNLDSVGKLIRFIERKSNRPS